jgi:hypothetical protein
LNCYENWYAHEYPVNPHKDPVKTPFEAVMQSAKDLLYQIYLLFFGKRVAK